MKKVFLAEVLDVDNGEVELLVQLNRDFTHETSDDKVKWFKENLFSEDLKEIGKVVTITYESKKGLLIVAASPELSEIYQKRWNKTRDELTKEFMKFGGTAFLNGDD